MSNHGFSDFKTSLALSFSPRQNSLRCKLYTHRLWKESMELEGRSEVSKHGRTQDGSSLGTQARGSPLWPGQRRLPGCVTCSAGLQSQHSLRGDSLCPSCYRPVLEVSAALRPGSVPGLLGRSPVLWGKGYEAKGHSGSQESFKLAVGTGEAQSREQSTRMSWPIS